MHRVATLPGPSPRPLLCGLLAASLAGVADCGAQQPQPDDAAARSLAARQLAAMSSKDKAGQLFVSWIRADAPAAERARIAGFVRDVGLGGVILSLGTVGEAADLVDELQRAAKVALLCAGDFEGGVAFRFDGATDMGNQMLVGATRLTRLARGMGEVTGREAKALGVPWVFAPVLDVNNNPDNPIINVRSFGEDPELVARLGCAFAAGVRSQGAIACGKHFPGHGDVSTDSHLALPTVPGDAAQLRARELLPFARAAAGGLESIMTGHLAVPGLHAVGSTEDPNGPATLSHRILTDVLRGELGFRGIVVTDALDMGGVRNALPPGEVAVRALLAGADVLLMPPDPVAARDAVVAAVERGRVGQERLDDAVLRLLRTKEGLGLLKPVPQGAQNDWREVVDTAESRRLADEIAQRGITFVRDPRGLCPFDRAAPWLVLSVQDEAEPGADEVLAEQLRQLGVQCPDVVRIDGAGETRGATAAIAAAERVLLSLHVRVRSYSGTIGLPPAAQQMLAALRPEQAVVAVSFGNPYLVQQLPPACAYVCAYAGGPRTEAAVAAALAGSAPAFGRLPVTIPGIADGGTGLTLLPGTDVPPGDAVAEGVAADLGAKVRAVLQRAVDERITPGAVCMVARHGKLLCAEAVGHHDYGGGAAPVPDNPPVTVDTPYDLASLTKVCATLPAVLALVRDGKLSLDDPVQKWLPQFQGTGKERVTVRHLLAHSSGLPAYVRYFRTLHGKDAIVAAAAQEGLMTEPGSTVVYSDLGLILTMAVVEACSGEPFAQFVRDSVWRPLGMRGARFAPTDGAPLPAPPTEDDPWRGQIVRGFVHDENAFAMGGISGHAGVFATADDVLRLGLCFLGRGRGVLPGPLVDLALQPQTIVGSDRLVGFDTLTPGGIGGAHVLPGTFGHTGFTGTSILCDPRRCVCVVLLTNRVHPTRVNARIVQLRRQVHDLVLGACE